MSACARTGDAMIYGEVERVAQQEVTEETRQMLPDVQTYTAAIEAADTALNGALGAVDSKYPQRHSLIPEVRHKEYLAWNAETNAAHKVAADARDGAWNALEGSSDPLVKWIAENCKEYSGPAAAVLKALPATLDELDDLAAEKEWCSTWSEFRDQAIAAGVLPDAEPLSAAHQAVLAVIDQEACCRFDARSRRRIGKALDALITEALQTAKEPAAV